MRCGLRKGPEYGPRSRLAAVDLGACRRAVTMATLKPLAAPLLDFVARPTNRYVFLFRVREFSPKVGARDGNVDCPHYFCGFGAYQLRASGDIFDYAFVPILSCQLPRNASEIITSKRSDRAAFNGRNQSVLCLLLSSHRPTTLSRHKMLRPQHAPEFTSYKLPVMRGPIPQTSDIPNVSAPNPCDGLWPIPPYIALRTSRFLIQLSLSGSFTEQLPINRLN